MAYVYRHIRLDKNVPFYIGICNKNDLSYFRAYEKTGRNKYWKNVVNKSKYEVEILFDNIEYSFAKEKEKEFISLYKRVSDGGTLVNLTLGGDGVLGFKNEKLSKRNKIGLWKGKKHTEETKRKISLKNKGKVITDGQKIILRELASKKINELNPNYRGNIYFYKNGVLLNVSKSLKDASNFLGLKSLGNISEYLNGKPHYMGYVITRFNWFSNNYLETVRQILKGNSYSIYKLKL